MTLRIDYSSRAFPASYKFRSGTLSTSWDELLWAAITLGRPSTYHVFRHGEASFHEAIFRLALIRMAVEQDWNDYLRRTGAFFALDPTEKGMVSYFLGMTLCKLFASQLLHTPWLLHLDVFRPVLNPVSLGRSRPDLVGEDISGNWHAFESKGRSSVPSSADKRLARATSRTPTFESVACRIYRLTPISDRRRTLLEAGSDSGSRRSQSLAPSPKPDVRTGGHNGRNCPPYFRQSSFSAHQQRPRRPLSAEWQPFKFFVELEVAADRNICSLSKSICTLSS